VKVIWVKSKAESEKAHLSGVSSNSNALNPMSTEYLKPFARYKQLHSSEGIVWNVFDRERVDPQKLTFDNHIEIVLRLMKEASASEKLISDIRNCLLETSLCVSHILLQAPRNHPRRSDAVHQVGVASWRSS
jgi:hypothetical protein